ncbi:MAG TPA: peptide chain release factor N(5)-glutamine methyltransferase [Bryobacteraceae bacterium]|nr:peptide chain release factor N(5)-glutamine methyltransferase [Bryobacteraceae bacterium]
MQQGTALLEEAGVGVPRLTAEVLLSHALRRERVYLYSHPHEELTELAWIHYGRYLHQRMGGTPTQYITRKQEFYGRDFEVSPAVLIPRPETEHLAAAAIELLRPSDLVIDVGCGSGAIAVTLACESDSRVLASDLSRDALCVARRNAERLGARVSFLNADLLGGLAHLSLDVIVSNPPYVGLHESAGLQREVLNHEPHMALFAGEDGNALYERLIDQSASILKPGGWLLLELGWKSLEPVSRMLCEGWTDIQAIPDLSGIPRVIRARLA